MATQQETNWQPISMLTFLTNHIADGIAMVARAEGDPPARPGQAVHAG
ncbi:hypothetical protein ACQP2T_61115 [Nonomuraea sp. CA-143628]